MHKSGYIVAQKNGDAVGFKALESGTMKAWFKLLVRSETKEEIEKHPQSPKDRAVETWLECELWESSADTFASDKRVKAGAWVGVWGEPVVREYDGKKFAGMKVKAWCFEGELGAALGGAPAKPAAKPASKPKPPSGDDLEALFAGEDEIAF